MSNYVICVTNQFLSKYPYLVISLDNWYKKALYKQRFVVSEMDGYTVGTDARHAWF